MTRSANEVETLIAKAARGAGAPPAQAATFGRAAVCHLTAGRGEEGLITALDALPQGPVLELPLALARLIETALEGCARGQLHAPLCPNLAASYADALPYKCTQTAISQGVDLVIITTHPAPRRAVQRLTLSDGFTAKLTALLANILVPETAESRLAGAGAGLTDND